MNGHHPGDDTAFRKRPAALPRLSLHRRTRSSAASVLLLLCGCVSYSPQPVDALAEIARLEERSESPRRLEVAPRGRTEWLPLRADVNLADGLDLAESNALALFYAPEVVVARRSERVAGAQLLGAGLLANPELFLGPRVSTQNSDLIFPATLMWELPLWGRPGAEKDVADRELSAAQVRVLETELRVLTEVRTHFITIANLTESLAILGARVRGSERILEWVAALQELGEVDTVTGYLARLELDDSRAALRAAELEIDSAKRSLFATVGLLPNAALRLVLEGDPARMPELPPPDRSTRMRHPEVRTALAEYEVAEASLKLEVAKQYPSISIGPDFESDRGDPTIGLGLAVELPIFDRNQGEVRAAQERREAARERLQNAILRVSHIEAQARAEADVARQMLADYRAGALATAAEAREALDLRLQTGQSEVLEVLAALQALAGAHIRELELERESAIARFGAAVAGGAVFDDPPRNDPEKEEG